MTAVLAVALAAACAPGPAGPRAPSAGRVAGDGRPGEPGPAWILGDVAAPPGGDPASPPGDPGVGPAEGGGGPVRRADPVAAADCETRFRLALPADGASVSAAGEWSGWDAAAHPMTDGLGTGVYETATQVPPGSWGYKLVVDGGWRLDPDNPRTRYVDGVENSRLDVPACPAPAAGPAEDQAAPPADAGDDRHDPRDGALYLVMVDRFRNGDPANDAPLGPEAGVRPEADWHGGDLQGVLDALREGWFDALGVKTLWLTPLYEAYDGAGLGKDGRSYSAYHGYWPVAARAVEPRFGGIDDLRTLADEAHARGLGLIVDLVWNHVHADHAYVREHPEWLRGDGGCICGAPGCGWDERALDCWFAGYLPDVDWTRTEVPDAFLADARWWLDAGGVDGFRVDAVKHMEDIAVTTLRTSLDGGAGGGPGRPGRLLYLLGETFTGTAGRALVSRYVGPHRLHGQFDFPLHWTAVDALLKETAPMRDLAAAVARSAADYPDGGRLMSPFLGNHDVERLLTNAGAGTGPAAPDGPAGDLAYARARLALAWLLTMPGVPLLYYGDEVGLPGGGDPDNRRPMPAEDALDGRQAALLAHVRRWGRLRADTPALRRGVLTTLHAGDDAWVYARGVGPGAVLVGLNRADEPVRIGVVVPPALATSAGEAEIEVAIPPRDAVLVRPGGADP